MKRGKILALLLMVVLTLTLGLTAVSCSKAADDAATFKVTFKNGDSVLKTDDVVSGKLATTYTPEVEGKNFISWHSSPSLTHKFDFTKPITADISVFGKFSTKSDVMDDRDFYIVGAGTSKVLSTSDWGLNLGAEHKLVKATESNTYSLTLDIAKGDAFQFAISSTWMNKRGFGYLAETKLDGVPHFSASGGLGDVTDKGKNIDCVVSGNYTIELNTNPVDDFYDVDNPEYKEETKEVFNMSNVDTITWVRNGDMVEVPQVVTDYYIKGSGITNWENSNHPTVKMANTDGLYTLSVYLNKDEEFMFRTTNTIGVNVGEGTVYVNHTNIAATDAASLALVTGLVNKNMVANASGMYTFTIDTTKDDSPLRVAMATAEVAKADYYLKGTYGGGNWDQDFKEEFKFVETVAGSGVYEIKNVVLAEGEEFMISSYKVGSTETGKYDTPSWNGLGNFNSSYLATKLIKTGEDADGKPIFDKTFENFNATSTTNLNFNVNTAGTYDISYDSYSDLITITASKA